jgi:hypothetical protein
MLPESDLASASPLPARDLGHAQLQTLAPVAQLDRAAAF